MDIGLENKKLGIFVISGHNNIAVCGFTGAGPFEYEKGIVAIVLGAHGNHIIVDYLIDIHLSTYGDLFHFLGHPLQKKEYGSRN
jgi:hypothetical protein